MPGEEGMSRHRDLPAKDLRCNGREGAVQAPVPIRVKPSREANLSLIRLETCSVASRGRKLTCWSSFRLRALYAQVELGSRGWKCICICERGRRKHGLGQSARLSERPPVQEKLAKSYGVRNREFLVAVGAGEQLRIVQSNDMALTFC